MILEWFFKKTIHNDLLLVRIVVDFLLNVRDKKATARCLIKKINSPHGLLGWNNLFSVNIFNSFFSTNGKKKYYFHYEK